MKLDKETNLYPFVYRFIVFLHLLIMQQEAEKTLIKRTNQTQLKNNCILKNKIEVKKQHRNE